jgi:hypothetical protein
LNLQQEDNFVTWVSIDGNSGDEQSNFTLNYFFLSFVRFFLAKNGLKNFAP